jgi:hypothetical protein
MLLGRSGTGNFPGYTAYWHVARLGILSLELSERGIQSGSEDQSTVAVREIADWLIMVTNANVAVFRPVLDIEHIQIYLMFEALRNANRLKEMATFISNLELRIYLRRATDRGLPFIDGNNSLENVFEQVATESTERLIMDKSSYFVLALLEMCCAFDETTRDDLLGRIHRHLVLGAAEVGDPGDRTPLDLVSWIPPQDWAQKVLAGPISDGEGVAVYRFADTREASGSQIFEGVKRTVTLSGHPKRYKEGRPFSGDCREKIQTTDRRWRVDRQKGASSEVRQVYRNGCPPGDDGGDRLECGRQGRSRNDRGDRRRGYCAPTAKPERATSSDV